MRASRSTPLRWREKNSYRPNAAWISDILEGTRPVAFDLENRDLAQPSGSFRDLASLDTGGANLHALSAAIGALHADGLQIWIKATARPIIRMRDIIAELRAFAADFASFSHD